MHFKYNQLQARSKGFFCGGGGGGEWGCVPQEPGPNILMFE